MVYECIKDFTLEKYDDNGFPTDEYTTINKGSKWRIDKKTDIIGGEIHLDDVENAQWIEISKETFQSFFINNGNMSSDYLELPEGCSFDTKFGTYIIAFCPDTDGWFVTNERFFYYEYDKEFQTREEGIEYFKKNPKIFYDEESRMNVYRPSFRKNGVWLNDTNEFITI